MKDLEVIVKEDFSGGVINNMNKILKLNRGDCMKKKIFFSIVLIILILSEVSFVYADAIIPGMRFKSEFTPYSDSEKLEKFINYMGSPLKESIIVLIIMFVILGITLITFEIIKDKKCEKEQDNNNSIRAVQKIFLCTNVALSLMSIYLMKVIRTFGIHFSSSGGVIVGDIRRKIITLYAVLIYIWIMLISSLISMRKKNRKVIYIVATCLTIAILLICFITFNNTNVGYITKDIIYTMY